MQPRLEGRIETIVSNLRTDMAEVESKANDAATTVEWFLQDQAEELTNKSNAVESRIEALEREIAHLRQSTDAQTVKMQSQYRSSKNFMQWVAQDVRRDLRVQASGLLYHFDRPDMHDLLPVEARFSDWLKVQDPDSMSDVSSIQRALNSTPIGADPEIVLWWER